MNPRKAAEAPVTGSARDGLGGSAREPDHAACRSTEYQPNRRYGMFPCSSAVRLASSLLCATLSFPGVNALTAAMNPPASHHLHTYGGCDPLPTPSGCGTGMTGCHSSIT